MKLLELLPSFYHNSDYVKALLGTQDLEVTELNKAIDDLINNLYIETATWGLEYFENMLGIKVDKSKPYNERRDRIKAKLRGNGTTTKNMIKSIAEAFSGSEVDIIENFNEYEFTVKFVGSKGVPANVEDFKVTIEEIKPAHLAYKLEFTYNTYKDLKQHTHSELSKFNYNQLRDSFLG